MMTMMAYDAEEGTMMTYDAGIDVFDVNPVADVLSATRLERGSTRVSSSLATHLLQLTPFSKTYPILESCLFHFFFSPKRQ